MTGQHSFKHRHIDIVLRISMGITFHAEDPICCVSVRVYKTRP